MVRASLGAYNTFEEIDAVVEMVERITRHDYHGEYCQAAETGDYRAVGAEEQVLGALKHFATFRGSRHVL